MKKYCSADLNSFEILSPHSISEWKFMGTAKPGTPPKPRLKCAPSQYYCPTTAVAAGENAQGQCVNACDMPASEDHSSKCIGFTDTTFDGDSRVCAIRRKCPPCHNGGVSLGHAKGCRCACDLGFQGTTCEELVPCTNLCKYGGIRLGSVRNNDCKCICQQGYAGTQCEIKLSCPNKCNEGNPRTNSCACGTKCKNSCVNGAYSQNPDGTPVCMCSCKLGWKGIDCSRTVPCTNICLNGGIREGTVASNTCRCNCERTGFSGIACTRPFSLWTALKRQDNLREFVRMLEHPDNAFYKDLLDDLSANPSYNNITVFAPLDLYYPLGGVDPSRHITPNGDHVQTFFESGHEYPTLGNYVKASVYGNRVILNNKVEIKNLKGYINAANGIIHPIKGYLGSNPCHFHSETSEECLLCRSSNSACLRAACWYGFDRDQNRCNSKPWCKADVCENGLLSHTEINDLYPPLSVKDQASVGDVMNQIQQRTGVALSKSNVIVNGLLLADLADQKPIADVRDAQCDPQESNCKLISVKLKLSRGNSPSECCQNEASALCHDGICSHLPLCTQARYTKRLHAVLMSFICLLFFL